MHTFLTLCGCELSASLSGSFIVEKELQIPITREALCTPDLVTSRWQRENELSQTVIEPH
jgi:hypothetical protein